jgi:hypothetical protein
MALRAVLDSNNGFHQGNLQNQPVINKNIITGTLVINRTDDDN